MPVNPVIPGPCKDGVRREFCAVVGNYHSGLSPHCDDGCQFPRHPVTGDRRVGNGAQAFMGDVIRDVQDPEPPAIGHLVVHEVQ